MINRIKLALHIIFGKSIILYDKNTKILLACIDGDKDILRNDINYAVDKHICENAGELRYLK